MSTLIVGMDGRITQEHAAVLKEYLSSIGIEAVIISGVTALAVVDQ